MDLGGGTEEFRFGEQNVRSLISSSQRQQDWGGLIQAGTRASPQITHKLDHGEDKLTITGLYPFGPLGELAQKLRWCPSPNPSSAAPLSPQPRYEEEVALRATAENEFVVLKKVRGLLMG